MKNLSLFWFLLFACSFSINAQTVTGISVVETGNVGIGTAYPQNILDVNDTVRAGEFIVETTWADYVFSDDYQLPSLTEIKHHDI